MHTQPIVSSTRADVVVHKAIASGGVFAKALCAHFGLPADMVESEMVLNNGPDEIFGVTLKIALTPEDLGAIAKHMETA